jgi:hypothetical protein
MDLIAQWEIGWKKFQEVILQNFIFTFVIRKTEPQLRKNHNINPLLSPKTLVKAFNVKTLENTLIFFGCIQLWKQVCRVLFGFCSAYIIKVFWLLFQNFVHPGLLYEMSPLQILLIKAVCLARLQAREFGVATCIL